jgi:type IV pilus assembly protein PilQ
MTSVASPSMEETTPPEAPAVSAAGNSTLSLADSSTIPTGKNVSLIMRGVSLPRAPITMDFQDADIRDVIHLLAVKSGINMIYGADVTGPITIHLDRVPFDQAFQTVLTLKSLVALPMASKVVRIISSTGLTAEQSQAATFTRVFRLNYAGADDVKKPVDAIRGAAGRKGVTSVDTKTNSLIVTDTQEGLKEVEDLIPALDKKPSQVDIEAKIVEVSLDDRTSMGISWAFARSAAGGNSYGASSLSFTNPGTSAASSALPIAPAPPASGGTGVHLFTDDAGKALESVGFSYIHGEAAYLLAAQLTLLANNNRLKVLSNPHIVTTNNEEANIDVVSKIPYQTSTISNGTIATSISTVEAGVKLKVKPTVNADRRITLKVHPEVSNTAGATFTGAPPVINTRDADTTVVLRDGETIAIGGLITENTQKIVQGIPLLMNIPILGYLFKTSTDSKQRVELIVFLTPKIAGE